jgi:hypothetical protein
MLTDAGNAPATGEQQTTETAATGEGSPGAVQQTTEPKPAESAKSNDTGKPTGAPEKYEFKLPEGVKLEGDQLAAIEKFARELNLSQEQAQKLVDRDIQTRADATAELLTKGEALAKQWEAETRSDKEIGGEALPANLAVAKKALDAFGTPKLREYLNETGLGNNPEVVKLFVRIGKAISEDGYVTTGGAQRQAPADPAKRLFPKMN